MLTRERDRARMKLRQRVSAHLLLAEYSFTVKCIEAYMIHDTVKIEIS